MKKNGLIAVLLLALFVGLLPKSAYATKITGFHHAFKDSKGFHILFEDDGNGPLTKSNMMTFTVHVDDEEFTLINPSAQLTDKSYKTSPTTKNSAKDGKPHAYILLDSTSIHEGSKIKIEVEGTSEPINLVVTNTDGEYTASVVKEPSPEDKLKKAAFDELSEYLKKVDKNALTEVTSDANKDAVKEFKDELQALEILATIDDPSQITTEELKRIQKDLGYQDDGTWDYKKGELRKLVKKIVVDFEVQGERTEKDKNTDKLYTAIPREGGEIKIKCAVKGLSKDADASKRLYLNAIKKEQYDDGKNVDATTSGTPRYKKAELDASLYEIEPKDDGYTIKVKALPEDIAILKPVVKVEIAPKAKAENGDLVFVKEKSSPSVTPSTPSYTHEVANTITIPEERGTSYGYALAPGGSVDSSARLRVIDKENGKRDVILVDGNGDEIHSDVLMMVTLPAPNEQPNSYRVKVGGVYTTYELSADGKELTLPIVFSHDGKMREDVVLREGQVTVKGARISLTEAYSLSVTDHGKARYTIHLLDASGNKVHSNGPVMVTIPAPQGAQDVYRVKADGKYITFEIEDGVIRFALVF